MIAEKLAVQRHGEGIVDLKRDDMIHSLPGEPFETAFLGEATEHAAVSIGSHGEVPKIVAEYLAGRVPERREIVLREEQHAILGQAESIVSGEEIAGGRVSG
jgi:hypothetical protein